ncbi:MAG: DUF262 domain-containing protein [Pantanalinema sp. GBBB05]|nr:DUF262 domain-containing protein [Pantanalinema sp. GBBB05]
MYFEEDNTGVEIEEEEIVEPFDPTKIKIDARQITIDLVLNRIKFGEIDLSPDFQRDSNIWNDTAKSRLIESMLIRIPLPAFYIDATNEDKWVVIDGQQRLTTIKNFVLGERRNDLLLEESEEEVYEKKFRLSKLEFLTQFNEKNYDELPRSYQRRINETQITVYLIEKETPEEVKFNIFRRINTGGLPLSSQEIRHALNQGKRGKSTSFLEKLAKSDLFKKATANGISDKRMAAREVALRFLAFKIFPYTEYDAKDLDSFLNKAMAKMNNMSQEELNELEGAFSRAMTTAFKIFGDDAFRKRYDKKASRSQINKALFEAWSVNLSDLNEEQIHFLVDHKEELKEKFIYLMNKDQTFNGTISSGTGIANRVKYRFSKIKELLEETLEMHSLNSLG